VHALIADRRLSRIVDDMFTLARADAGNYPTRPIPMYLDEVVDDVVRAARVLASTRGVSIEAETTRSAASTGDEDLIRRLMRQAIPIAGLFGTMALAAYMVVQLSGQARARIGDFTNAATAEVRDAQGQVVLRGPFVLADEEDDDIERKTALEPTGVDADAAGEAEVEFSKEAPAEQDVEFSVRNLQAGAVFTFVIDGVDLATATADRRGRAEVELDVRTAGATASR
jgi:hypothetical protein